MSRTYRTAERNDYYLVHGNRYTLDELIDYGIPQQLLGYDPWGSAGVKFDFRWTNKGRDRKPWNKPPRWYKRMKRQGERAQVRQAMRLEKWETIPVFKHSDQWDWT